MNHTQQIMGFGSGSGFVLMNVDFVHYTQICVDGALGGLAGLLVTWLATKIFKLKNK